MKTLVAIWVAAIVSGVVAFLYINNSINQICRENMQENGVVYAK